MATNTSGITIPILAKIEGWQAELKRILEEAKKVNLGTQFGKDLLKNIAALEKQINSMAQTLTHRLTSDSGIDNFSDKLNEVETRFKVIGDTLSNITLSNLDVSYIDSLLKPLLDKIEALLTLLNTDLDATFSDKIVTEATKVQKAFARIGKSEEDIRKLGREGTRSALEEIISSSIKKAEEASEKINNLLHDINEFRKAELNWLPSTFAKETNIDSYVSSIVSKDPTSYGFTPVINEKALDETKKKIEESINEIKLSDAKKADIQKYLNDLVPTSSVELIRKRIGAIELVLLNVAGRAAFGLDSKSFDKYLSSIFNETDFSIIDANLNKIKERFLADGITEEDLNKFWGSFSDAIKNQDFDKAIDIVSTNLTLLLTEYKNGKDKIVESRKLLEEALKVVQSDLFKIGWTRTFGEAGLKEFDEFIAKAILASAAALELQKTEKELEGKKIEILLPTLSVGKSISDDAVKRWYENTSAALVYKSELDLIKSRELMLGNIQGVILRWFSVYAAVRMVSNAIKSVINTVKELDSTITEIAIVTKMDLNDLWGLMDSYTDLARQYAASISGVYKVSLLYYQLGLLTADVMALTEQTLKMARISGLDYAQATDYMTNAVRSFKMEMTDALNVVDVYSAIAASSATSVTELASAMSKTASSAQAVGSSFENTTAMMAVMIEATRESAENIGSAMKSIISRYGEMTSDPSKLMDSEGEEMSLNRVDKALQTVGISIHNTAGEFRNFDEVIMELALKWDTIDTNTLRYIATTMAGNRQLSRFLALVSSYDRLKELSEEAANSENASLLQFLKTLDSVGAKIQLLLTSLLSLYTASGVEKTYKTILDLGNSIIQTFTNMETVSGFPVLAITRLGTTFASLALIVTNIFKVIKTQYSLNLKELEILLSDYLSKIKPLKEREVELERQIAADKVAAQKNGLDTELENVRAKIAQEEKLYKDSTKRRSATKISMTTGLKVGMISSSLGMIGTTIASTMNLDTQRDAKGWTTIGSSIASGVGTAALMGGGPLGVLMGVATSLSGILEGIGILTETVDEKVNKLESDIKTTSNTKLLSKDLLLTLTDYKKKYDELSKALHKSVEDKKAFIDLLNEIAASYPELIASMDSEGNYVISMTAAYEQLALAKLLAYKQDFINNLQAELNGLNDIDYVMDHYYHLALPSSANDLLLLITGRTLSKIGNLNDSLALNTAEERISSIESWLNPSSLTNIFEDISSGTHHNNILELAFADYSSGAVLHASPISFNENGKEIYALLINDFYELASLDISLIDAKSILSNKEIYADYIDAINSFKAEIYNSFLAESNAIEVQSTLIDNLFKTKASEWILILAQITGNTTTEVQADIITDELLEKWNQYEQDIENGMIDGITKKGNKYIDSEGKELKRGDIFSQFLNEYSIQWYSIIEELTHYLQDEVIEDLYKNRGHYSRSLLELQDGFKKLGTNTLKFLDSYDKAYKEVFERYDTFLSEDLSFIGNDNLQLTLVSFKDLIGPDFLQGIIDQYQKILDNTNLTQSEQAGLIDTLTSAINSLLNLSENDLIKALATLLTADLTSLFGIYKFLEDLNKKDINLDGTGVVEAFRLFSHTLNVNLESELNSYGETISKISEDYSKDLSDATKGMDLKKASEMSKKFNISLADFDYSNNKFFLSNLDIIKSYYLDLYQAYADALLVEFALLSEGYKNLEGKTWNYHLRTINWNDVFNKNFTLKELDQKFADLPDMQANFKEETDVEYSDFRNLYEQFLNQDEIGNFFTFLDTYYSDLLQIYSDYFKDLEADALKSAAKNYLSMGNIEKFADIIFDGQALKRDLTKFLLNAFKNGDLANILLFVPAEYAQMVADTFKDSIKSVYDSFSLEGDIGTYITSDALNANVLAALELDGLATRLKEEEGNIVYELATITEENIDTYIETIKNSDLTPSVKADKLAEAHAFKYKDKVSAFTTLLSDEDIDYNSAENLAEALGYTADLAELAMKDLGFILNEATGKWHRSAQSLTKIQERIDELEALDSLELADANELAALSDTATSFEIVLLTDAIDEILSNYQSISPLALAHFATALGDDYDTIKSKIAKYDGKGNYSIDPSAVQEVLLTENLSEAARNLLELLLAGIGDDYLEAMDKAEAYVLKGTTKLADMTKFILSYNDLVKPAEDLTVQNAFTWNEALSTFTLNSEFLDNYLNAYALQLEKLGIDGETYKESLIQQIKDAPDISAFLSAEDRSTTSKAYAKLKNELENLFAYLDEEVAGAYDSAGEYATSIIAELEKGGNDAVTALRTVHPDATADQLEEAYYHVFNELSEAADSLSDIKVGSFVTGKLKDILSSLDMVDVDGTVNSSFDMVEAYNVIYELMKATNTTTILGLNSVYALMMTALDLSNIDITELLNNAGGMSYDAFGKLLANYGIKLETVFDSLESLAQFGVKRNNYGQVILEDFNKFKAQLEEQYDIIIDETSQEYFEAYSTYVDARVKRANQESTNISTAVDLIKDITEAKAGESLNVYAVSKAFENAGLNESLTAIALHYGAILKDGMLTITTWTDIPGIILDIAKTAADAGILIPELLAELTDAIADMLSNITSLISKGIEGQLTNVESVLLQLWASSNNLGALNFTLTADGLQLAANSLADVYVKMKSIDSLLASTLLSNIMKTKDSYLSLTGALMEFNDALSTTNDTLSHTTELLADVVLKNLTSADSMNFMSNSLPKGMLTAVNAWENASKAINILTTGLKKGYMGVQDFYNIVTTASSLLEAAGQDFSIKGMNAAELIELAGQNLKVVGGKLQIDLSASGMDITGSIGDLKNQMTDGILELAKAEIEMLDAEIQVLEVLVAMENLDDVDVNGNGIGFEIEDIFEFDGDGIAHFTSEMQTYLEQLKAAADSTKGLSDTMKSIKINGKNFYDLLSASADDWIKAFGSAENVSKALLAFTLTDWDLTNIQDLVLRMLLGLNTYIEIDLGDHKLFTISASGAAFTFDFGDVDLMAEVEKAAKALGIDSSNIEATIRKYIADSNNEELPPIDWEKKVQMNAVLSIASRRVTISERKDENGKGTGIFEGVYNGRTFTGNSEKAVLELIGKAMSYEDEGYNVNYNSDAGTITGEKKYRKKGKLIVDHDQDKPYTVEGMKGVGGPFATEAEAINALVQAGWATEDLAGKVYNIGEDTFTVSKDLKTNLLYTFDENNNNYKFEGQTFDTYDKLINYLAFSKFLGNRKSTPGKNDAGQNTEVVNFDKNGRILMTYNYETGEVIYTLDGEKFKSPEDFEGYLSAFNANGGVINDNGSINYSIEGQAVNVYRDAQGNVVYSVDFHNGKSFTANNEDAVKTGIAMNTVLEGGNINKTPGTVTYTIGNETFTVIIGEDGQLKLDDASKGSKKGQELIEQYNAQLLEGAKSADPVEILASSVNIIMGPDTKVSFDSTENAKLPTNTPNIESLSATVSTLNITAAEKVVPGEGFNITNNDLGNINPDEVVALLAALGINSVLSLYEAVGMTLPSAQLSFGIISSLNVIAALAALAIDKVNSLTHDNTTYPEDVDWQEITATVSATLSNLGIDGVTNLQLTAAGITAVLGKTLNIDSVLALAGQFNLLNTTGQLKDTNTITVTGITNAEGQAGTLTITKITGDKTVTDLTNLKAGSNISAHADGTTTITSDSYKLDWTTIDAETGEVTVLTITVPADLNFGEAGSLAAYLALNPGSVVVTTNLNNTIQDDLKQQNYSVEVTAHLKFANGEELILTDEFLLNLQANNYDFSASLPKNLIDAAVLEDALQQVTGDNTLTLPIDFDTGEIDESALESFKNTLIEKNLIPELPVEPVIEETSDDLIIEEFIEGLDGVLIPVDVTLNEESGVDSTSFNEQLQNAGNEGGENLTAGEKQGVEEGTGQVLTALEALGTSSLDTLKTALQEQSPSKATDEMGLNLDAGLVQGIEAQLGTVINAGTTIGTAVIEAISTAITEGMTTLSEGITEAVESVDKSYAELETRTELVAGSIRSHWEALVNLITAAVTLIRSLVLSLLEKISITWTIGSKDGKSDLAGSGSGVNKDATRGVTALTEYMDKMLSTMEHNKKNDTFKVKMPTLTIDTSTTKVNIDDIGKKVLEEATKNPVESLTIPVGAVTVDLAGASVNIGENSVSTDENSQVTLESVKGVVGTLGDELDMTLLPLDLGELSVKEGTKITISNPINAVVGKLNLEFSDASEITVPDDAEKPEIDIDVKPAEDKITELQELIDGIKLDDELPKINVDITEANTNLTTIQTLITDIANAVAALTISIPTDFVTLFTSLTLNNINTTLANIIEKKTIPIKISLDAKNVLSELGKILLKLTEILEKANISINGGVNGKTPEGGETPKEGETPQENLPTTTTTEVSLLTKVTTPGGTEIEMNAKVTATEIDGSLAPAVEMPVEADSVTANSGINPVPVPAEAESVDVPSGTTVAIQASIDVGEAGQSLSLTATYTVTTTGDIPADKPNLKATYIGVNGGGYIPGDITAYVTYIGRKGGGYSPNVSQAINATGNIGLAKALGTRTLMGELGPELVVSNGRYFVAGQNGAEMVDLDKDAIVFNHLQTEQLLKNGMSKGRGRAVTNERNAVAFAKGNIGGGPAMASASAALAVLKQIRSMWQSLLSASAKDLAGAGGSGGGGGGGKDKGGKGSDAGRKSFIEDVERWYNLMQEIAKLEKVINHEETLRAKLEGDLHKNGSAYYKSLKESLSAILKEIKAQEELNISRREYFNLRRKQLNEDNGPFNQLYEFDPQGQLKYKDNTTIKGSKATNGYAFLADLMAQNPNTGKPKYTVELQYKILKKAGFAKYMKFDSSGNEIKLGGTDSDEGPSEDDYNTYYSSMVLAFWDRVEALKSEMQTLYDTVADGENNLLELELQRNELLEAMYDNQKELENSVLNAIEDMRQREIDALLDERDKLEEATGKYIEGLSDALDKERQMYDTQENQNELDTKKRRLGILLRSGASAEDIYSLQKEITESEKNMYFDAQLAQIDAIQLASDLEIERLDTQILIMQDTLDFLKEMGLLWYLVYDVMGKSSAEITQFVMGNDSLFWNKSPLESEQTYEKTLFKAKQWKSFSEDQHNISEILTWNLQALTADALSTYSDTMSKLHDKDDFWKNNKERYEGKFTEVFEETGDRTKAATAASQMFETDKAWNDRETTAGNRFVGSKETEYVDIDDTYHWVYTYEKEKYTGLNEKYKDQEQLYFKSREKKKHVWGSDGLCTKCGHKKPKEKSSSNGGGGGSRNCDDNCAGVCKGQLSGGTSCSKNCANECRGGCKTGCLGGCTNACKNRCTGTCSGNCTSLGGINGKASGMNNHPSLAKGNRTLIGELGPELVVSNGQYRIAGQSGAEFVNLPDDAIVFNHMQTRSLLQNDHTGRGKSVLNDARSIASSDINLVVEWKNSLLSKKVSHPASFAKAALDKISATWNNLTTNALTQSTGNIIIENATVNMNVQKIANDYDAKRAGEQALNEMLRIANKTSAANNIRR